MSMYQALCQTQTEVVSRARENSQDYRRAEMFARSCRVPMHVQLLGSPLDHGCGRNSSKLSQGSTIWVAGSGASDR